MFKVGDYVCLNYNIIGCVDRRIGVVRSIRGGRKNEKITVFWEDYENDNEFDSEWSAKWLLLV